MPTSRLLLSFFCGLVLAACGGETGETEPVSEVPSEAPADNPQATPLPAVPAALPRQPAPEGAEAYIISPADGESVSSPVRVVFGLKGIGVAPAGIQMPATGHHHLLVDTQPPPFGLPIPTDENHIHFGAGQTETVLELPPGEHRLQLLLGDHLHIPHDPPVMSAPVTIQVIE